jgi:two-component system sensor histidine kinase PhcS
MIYVTGEAHSSYYAGLTLCIVGTSFIFHWTYREIGITLAIVLAMYFTATIPNLNRVPSTHAAGVFVNNTMFILLNCAILYVSSRQHYAIRIKEFLSRWLVEEQHQELAARNIDLTEALRRLHDTEAQLDHSDRLASIGRLSAGIIHEINNPLNFVKSALYVLNKKTRSMPPELAESVSNITRDVGEGVDRVVAIVSDLRTFAHPDQRALHPVEVERVMNKAERFLARDICDNQIQLTIKTEPGLFILGDDREVLQVLINLAQNSIDALQGRPVRRIEITTESSDQGVRVSVLDTGIGISQGQASKIFDPFYTTKEVGKGMGLGLSICYRMMQQMEGDIEVESVAGEYTRFTLVFQKAAHANNDRRLNPPALAS